MVREEEGRTEKEGGCEKDRLKPRGRGTNLERDGERDR